MPYKYPKMHYLKIIPEIKNSSSCKSKFQISLFKTFYKISFCSCFYLKPAESIFPCTINIIMDLVINYYYHLNLTPNVSFLILNILKVIE